MRAVEYGVALLALVGLGWAWLVAVSFAVCRARRTTRRSIPEDQTPAGARAWMVDAMRGYGLGDATHAGTFAGTFEQVLPDGRSRFGHHIHAEDGTWSLFESSDAWGHQRTVWIESIVGEGDGARLLVTSAGHDPGLPGLDEPVDTVVVAGSVTQLVEAHRLRLGEAERVSAEDWLGRADAIRNAGLDRALARGWMEPEPGTRTHRTTVRGALHLTARFVLDSRFRARSRADLAAASDDARFAAAARLRRGVIRDTALPLFLLVLPLGVMFGATVMRGGVVAAAMTAALLVVQEACHAAALSSFGRRIRGLTGQGVVGRGLARAPAHEWLVVHAAGAIPVIAIWTGVLLWPQWFTTEVGRALAAAASVAGMTVVPVGELDGARVCRAVLGPFGPPLVLAGLAIWWGAEHGPLSWALGAIFVGRSLQFALAERAVRRQGPFPDARSLRRTAILEAKARFGTSWPVIAARLTETVGRPSPAPLSRVAALIPYASALAVVGLGLPAASVIVTGAAGHVHDWHACSAHIAGVHDGPRVVACRGAEADGEAVAVAAELDDLCVPAPWREVSPSSTVTEARHAALRLRDAHRQRRDEHPTETCDEAWAAIEADASEGDVELVRELRLASRDAPSDELIARVGGRCELASSVEATASEGATWSASVPVEEVDPALTWMCAVGCERVGDWDPEELEAR